MVAVEVATEGVVVGMMAVVWEEEEGEVETRARWKLVLATGTVHRKLSFFVFSKHGIKNISIAKDCHIASKSHVKF